MVMLLNGKSQAQVSEDLEAFLGKEQANAFAKWFNFCCSPLFPDAKSLLGCGTCCTKSFLWEHRGLKESCSLKLLFQTRRPQAGALAGRPSSSLLCYWEVKRKLIYPGRVTSWLLYWKRMSQIFSTNCLTRNKKRQENRFEDFWNG